MAKLKIWNGNVQTMVPHDERKKYGLRHNSYTHAYACASSVAKVAQMILDWSGGGGRGLESYIRDYWNAGSWGNSMNGVEPEEGLWIQYGDMNAKPVRVWPKDSHE